MFQSCKSYVLSMSYIVSEMLCVHVRVLTLTSWSFDTWMPYAAKPQFVIFVRRPGKMIDARAYIKYLVLNQKTYVNDIFLAVKSNLLLPLITTSKNIHQWYFSHCQVQRAFNPTGSLWYRQSQQSFNMLTPFYFPFSLTTCFGPYGPSSGEIYN
jgi:hypothetical protein